jgi:hypothetical protein
MFGGFQGAAAVPSGGVGPVGSGGAVIPSVGQFRRTSTKNLSSSDSDNNGWCVLRFVVGAAVPLVAAVRGGYVSRLGVAWGGGWGASVAALEAVAGLLTWAVAWFAGPCAHVQSPRPMAAAVFRLMGQVAGFVARGGVAGGGEAGVSARGWPWGCWGEEGASNGEGGASTGRAGALMGTVLTRKS